MSINDLLISLVGAPSNQYESIVLYIGGYSIIFLVIFGLIHLMYVIARR